MLGELNQSDMAEILDRNFVGQLGCHDGLRPYIVPINFIFHENSILAHSMEGKKIDMMRKHPEVCFSVYEMKDNVNWSSVIIWGRYEELIEERDRYDVIKRFTERMLKIKIFPDSVRKKLESSETILNYPASARPILFRIRINEISGRFERS